MKVDYVKVAVVGVKVLAAVVGGIAVFAGLTKLVSSSNDGEGGSEYDEETNQGNEDLAQDDVRYDDRPPRHFSGGQGVNRTGTKIINGIRCGQMALNGAMNIIQGVVTVASNINRVFDKRAYKTMLNDPSASTGFFGTQMIPSYAAGDYPWNRPADPGLPYDTPIYRGKDNSGDDIWWLRRNNNVIEVW